MGWRYCLVPSLFIDKVAGHETIEGMHLNVMHMPQVYTTLHTQTHLITHTHTFFLSLSLSLSLNF